MHASPDLPPLDGLSALLAAADGGSFTAAAQMLGLTHGSVSRRISVLEAWLGTRLFERHGRGVRLTPAGQRFTNDARAALGGLHRSTEQWRPWQGRQTVRLSVVPSFARLWMLPRLAQIELADIRIELILDHRPSDLDAREADLAVRYGLGNWEGVHVSELFAETLVPAAAPALADQLGGDVPVKTLLSAPLIHDSDTSQWRAWLAAANIRYRPRWQDRRFEDYDTVVVAAQAGLGVALLRLPLVQEVVDQGGLRPISTRSTVNPAKHFICTRENESRAAVLEVADRLRRLCGAEAAMLTAGGKS
ncbi:LysR substrate-binding domain-containing protein [Sphingomonas sp. DT-204]|uniref:LysR substrate-binding domain-containing protein n=1 Tax=Sphingomonas sp. DT-204 TaxID=3396166 RepID=UPI003F1B6F05